MKSIKVWGMLAFLMLALSICASAQNVSVNPGGGTYPTLKDAFDAINAGIHGGAVTVDIVNSTAETAPAVLNSSGAGLASYTSVTIRPTSDGLTISGATATGRGLIELNGADNVFINGDNAGTAGTNRNLTITNTAAATTTFTSVIRIALSTLVTSGNNNTVRNCIINGSATGRNVAAATAQAGSEFTTYGILVGGGASTVAATTAPSAIASVATTIGAGITATNFTARNNAVDAAARGIAVQGAATTVATGLTVSDNVIGNASAASTTTVYARGITLQGFDNAVIARNTVQNIQYFVNTQEMGISLGDISASGQNGLVERNIVNNVNNQNAGTFGAYGINVNAGNNITVQNNFVTGVTGVMTGGAAFSTTFGLFGIRLGTGTGHRVYHNSVNMFGLRAGTAATSLLGANVAVVTATQTGIDIRNNIFVNSLSGGTTSIAYVCVYLPAGATVGMNLTINNNDYYLGAAPTAANGYGQAGTTAGTNFFSTFDATMTTPATNLRSYTSTLSAAGTNDNASQNVDPQYVSATDLHIAAGSPMVNAGAAVGVTLDIDGQTRVAAPDIGADEPAGTPAPANDIAATAILVPVNGSSVSTGTTVTPQATFTNVGTGTQTSVNVQFTITGPGGYAYSNSQVIASMEPNDSVTVTFAVTPVFTTGGLYTMTATVTTADGNAGNDSVVGSFTAVVPLNGAYSVGAGGDFPSLTNAGGIFAAVNAAGISGNVVINITSDLAGETGAVTLNEVGGGFTVTIRPSGGARTISGTAPAAGGMIGFNSTDRVTINGSLTGGNDRSLTILPSNTLSNGAAIYFASGTNGAQNNTIQNVNIFGAGANAGVLLGIAFASSTFGAVGVDNDNNRIINNDIRGAFYGIGHLGASNANKDTGLVIASNVMPGVGTAGIGRAGIYIIFADGAQIVANVISSVATTGGVDCVGIAAGSQSLATTAPAGGISNVRISRNYIGVVSNTGTFSSAGIVVASDTTGTNIVDNNMVTGVLGDANAGDILAGIYVAPAAGATQNIYYNSVSMTGDRGTVTANMFPSFALAIASDQPMNVRNNALVNSQIRGAATTLGGESYAIGFDGPAANVNLLSNNNDLFVTGPLGRVGITGDLTTAAQGGTAGTGTNRITLTDWQTATTEDAASQSVDPLFTSPMDLHLQVTSPIQDDAVPLAGFPLDYDLQLRGQPPIAPLVSDKDAPLGGGNTDIGADEILAPTSAQAHISGRVITSSGAGIRNAIIVVTGGGLTEARTVATGTFGYFAIEDLEVGQTYIVTINSKRFVFPTPTVIITLEDNVEDLEFQAFPGQVSREEP